MVYTNGIKTDFTLDEVKQIYERKGKTLPKDLKAIKNLSEPSMIAGTIKYGDNPEDVLYLKPISGPFTNGVGDRLKSLSNEYKPFSIIPVNILGNWMSNYFNYEVYSLEYYSTYLTWGSDETAIELILNKLVTLSTYNGCCGVLTMGDFGNLGKVPLNAQKALFDFIFKKYGILEGYQVQRTIIKDYATSEIPWTITEITNNPKTNNKLNRLQLLKTDYVKYNKKKLKAEILV